MKKRVIATPLLIALSVTLFAACGKKEITPAKVQEIALQELGTTAEKAGHTHVEPAEYDGVVCYMVHVTLDGQEHYVYVDTTGKVLHKQ